MKISILLPYKENFSPNYAGAVSLFVNDITKISKYKKNICVYGSTNFNKKFQVKYHNLDLQNNFTKSQSKSYIIHSICISEYLMEQLFSYGIY